MSHKTFVTALSLAACSFISITATAQTVGNRASTVDTSSGARDFVTSSSPLPDGGTIMSSHYPGNPSATYVAEATLAPNYGASQGYQYQQQQPTGNGYQQSFQQNNPQYQQFAPETRANADNREPAPLQNNNQSPTQQVSYQTTQQPAYNNNQVPQYRMPTYPNYPANHQNYGAWQQGYGPVARTAANTSNDSSGLQWRTAGTAAYTAQAPACCGSQPPASNVYAPGFQPPPQQYAPVQQPPTAFQAPAPPTGYNPYGYTNPAVNRATWRPLIPLRALPAGTYVGQGLIGQPVAYVDGEPVRNFFRYVSP